jgi:glycosyltransferase involved in cell wall biosynthesis
MRIAVVAPSSVPFVLGGAERLYHGLLSAVNELTPHDAELLKLPTPEHTLPDIVRSYRAFAELDVSHFDAVISTKYPSWMVHHPDHRVYMLHPLRGLYDTYRALDREPAELADPAVAALRELTRSNAGRESLTDFFGCFEDLLTSRGAANPAFAFPGPLARDIVQFLDRIALSPGQIRRYFAISRTVATRRGYFPASAAVETVYPPSHLTPSSSSDFRYFFTASRLEAPKRMHLLIEAMSQVPHRVELKIAGTGPELDRLRGLAAGDERISFLGYVSSSELAQLYGQALAVPFVPEDEDFGLIALEAMAAGKAVLTCTDSGGPTEIVTDGVDGLITAPEPRDVAAALSRLAGDAGLARRLGESARERAGRITWRRAVATLIGQEPHERPLPPSRAPKPRRPKVVVTSTFVVSPPRGGGQLRCFHLYGALTHSFDVEIVSLGEFGASPVRHEIAPGMIETVVPKSLAHQRQEVEISDAVGLPLTDILAGPLSSLTPDYMDALSAALQGAHAILLAHPFLYPAVKAIDQGLPLYYDAHNVEFVLKGHALPDTPLGQRLVRLVRDVEMAAAREAELVSVCSARDGSVLAEEFGLVPDRILVVENGVDAAAVAFVGQDQRSRNSAAWRRRYGQAREGGIVLFVGSWHPPNLEAAETIFSMASKLPELLFLHVGSHCDFFLGAELPANVVLVGGVSDRIKTSLLGCADVALNPMASGSGTNLKLVEYFASGVPVVSTPLGARGLDVSPDEHLKIVTIDSLESTIVSLLAAPHEADRMASRARALVEERYDWARLGARLRERVIGARVDSPMG